MFRGDPGSTGAICWIAPPRREAIRGITPSTRGAIRWSAPRGRAHPASSLIFYEVTNQRTDESGGKTIGERNRFAVEVVESVRDAVGPEMVVILRLSRWKIGACDHEIARTPEEMEQWLLPLAAAGADILRFTRESLGQYFGYGELVPDVTREIEPQRAQRGERKRP